MEADKVDKFLLANEGKFRITKFPSISCSISRRDSFRRHPFQKSGKILLLSIFLGVTGLDRFLIGNIGKALANF